MTYQEEYDKLDARQLALITVMGKSDAHALKCVKRGISFQETYPEEYAEYDAAVVEYNTNETRMAELAELIKEEEEAKANTELEETPAEE